jgi:UDP-N-acetylglucosamine 4,6-dehydratase
MEYNPMEAVKTNVIGTQNVLEAAGEAGVTNLITLSTDKAVHPLNLYGASKLCAEKLTVSANNVYPDTNFNVVRYGNVALSNGSVIPLFKEWRRFGMPLQITNMDMTRFWITLYQAAHFIIDRLFMPYNNVRGVIYIPDMDAYHMKDLVEIFSTKGVNNKIIGIRPGEKIHEQIITDSEALRSSRVWVGDNNEYTMVYRDGEEFINSDMKQVIAATYSNLVPRIPVDDLSDKIEALL